MSYENPPPPPPPPPPLVPERAQRRRRWPWLVGGLAAAALIGAVVYVAQDDSNTTQTDVPQAARDYFEALATRDPSDMGVALDVAAADSPAELYATHQIAFAGIPYVAPSTTTVDVGDDNIVLTTRGVLGDGITEFENSATFSDFTLVDDRLATFSVDDNPVADRIRAGDPAGVSSNGVTVKIITAYQAHEGDLYLNVEIANMREAEVQTTVSEWTLDTADGRQLKPTEPSKFLSSIQPGTTQPHFVRYEQVPLGGTLGVEADAFDLETGLRFDVPVPSTTTTSDVPSTTTTSESSSTTEAGTSVFLEDLRLGDCFNDSAHGTDEVGEITVVDCDSPHDAEVFGVPTLPGEPTAPYPGDDEIDILSDALCMGEFATYVGVDFQDSMWEYGYSVPTEETWRKYDDRLVVCSLNDPNFAKIEGSQRNSRT